jgi:magnesium transporter
MIQVSVCNGKMMRKDAPLAEAVASAAQGETGGKTILWVDVVSPTEEDWKALQDAFGFHPLAIEDAQDRAERAKLDLYETEDATGAHAFLSIRAWAGGKSATDDLLDATQEIDVFLGRDYIVTIHDGTCDALTQVRQRWHRNSDQLALAREIPGFLLYLI